MSTKQETACPGCGGPLPEPVMCSISHTIVPGERLCIECGRRESVDPVWCECWRIGQRRAAAATEAHARVLESCVGCDADIYSEDFEICAECKGALCAACWSKFGEYRGVCPDCDEEA